MKSLKPFIKDGISFKADKYFQKESFECGFGPVSDEFLEILELEDVTHDSRWFYVFESSSLHGLGAFRDKDNGYWVFEHNEAEDRYIMQFAGNNESELMEFLEIEDEDENE